jgi:PAS domain S-box-containing protein
MIQSNKKIDVNEDQLAQGIVETIAQPFIILDQDFTVVLANRSFYMKFQTEKSKTEGMLLYTLGNNQWDIPKLRNFLEKLIPENEKFDNYIVEHDFPEIGHRIMKLNAMKILLKDPKQDFILLAIDDVTEAVRSRRKLEQSEALIRKYIEEINSIIIEIDSRGVIRFLNRFTEKLFGYPREELMGKNIVGTIFPTADSMGNDNTGLVENIIRNPVRYYYNESEAQHETGREILISWSSRMIKASEKDETVILIDGNDMTPVRHYKRQAREALDIVHATAVPILRLDAHKICRFSNKAFANLVGKPNEVLEGAALSETGFMKDLIPRLEAAHETALKELNSQVIETKYNDKFFLVRIEPECDSSYSSCSAIIFFYEITARRRAEEALQSLTTSLEQQVTERTKLAETRLRQLQELTINLIEAEERERKRIAEILHNDLQQLLASASMQLQVVIQQHPGIDMLNNVEQIVKTSMEKSRSLSHELDFPALQSIDLASAIEWLVRRMDKMFGMQVRIEKTGLPRFASTPFKLFLFRALQELLFNTVKHSGVKDAQLIISRTDEDLNVTVADQGRGFNTDLLSFPENMGLGLSSLIQRARSLGGDLAVESIPGKGSRFTLTVPASLAE